MGQKGTEVYCFENGKIFIISKMNPGGWPNIELKLWIGNLEGKQLFLETICSALGPSLPLFCHSFLVKKT